MKFMKTIFIEFINRILVMFFIIFATIIQSYSQAKVGTTAAQFLGIGVGPKAIAMGCAYVAGNEDVTSIYWNPGAFVQANKSEIVFSNTEWLVGTKFRWVGFMYNLDGTNSFGLSLTQLDYGDDEVTTESQPDGTGERWSAQDLAFTASYSRRLTDRFSLGGTAKYVSQSIWNETASCFTFDLGLLFITGFNNMRLGMSMSNFGGELTLDGRDLLQKFNPKDQGENGALVGKKKVDSWPLPLLFRVGVAMDIIKNNSMNVTLACDALRPSDNVMTMNVGGEAGWRDMIFIRTGYKSLFAEDNQEGWTIGAGFRYKLEGVGFGEIDYAMNKFGLFNNLNTISISIGF
jgi:hypothetical protein